jgi:L-ascorbate metabolism protein UlaG (beta-lactamase superfamily)
VRITYYWYNAFVLEGDGKRLIIDPGQDLHWRRLNSLIPKGHWSPATLILATHGDEDHAEYVPKVAAATGAPIVCHPRLAAKWEKKGLNVVPLAPGEMVEAAGIGIRGFPVWHGPVLNIFGRKFEIKSGTPAVAMLFELEGKQLLNLGDTLLLEDAWTGLRPDVLMIPVGGLMTLDVEQALEAVRLIQPKVAIPVHHNWHILFYHRPADIGRFAEGVQQMGMTCLPLQRGESVELA